MSDSHRRQRFAFPGGENLELTPLEAAREFSKRWLPPLNKKSVFVPETIVDHGHTTQAVFLSDVENMLLQSKIEDKKETEKFKLLTNTHLRGSTSELQVWNYIKNSESINKTLVTMILSYKIKDFNYFLDYVPYSAEGEQEFDIILVLPEYKCFIMFEVKSFQATKTLRKPQAQLENGFQFFQTIISYLGKEEFQGWEFIPVIALPNVFSLDQVKCKEFKEKVITQAEMRKDILDVLNVSKTDSSGLSEYESLAMLLIASKHFERVKEENGTINLELEMLSAPEVTHRKQFGVGAEPVTVGTADVDNLTPEIKFSVLENKPFASLESIIFWNREQLDFLYNKHPKILISGCYGTGKTLLLIAKMDMLLRDGVKVAFISFVSKDFTKFNIQFDSKHYPTTKEPESKNYVFNERIKYLCKTRNVDFFCPTDIESLKHIVQERKDAYFVMDEVKSEFIKDVASLLERAVIAMHIYNGVADIAIKESMKDYEGWTLVQLSIPLRNTTNMQKLDAYFDCDKLKSGEDTHFTTLLGPVPKMVICKDKKDAFTIGLDHALRLVQGERKIVIIISQKESLPWVFLEWVWWRIEKVSGLNVYEFSGEKDACIQWKLFNEAVEGCLVTYDSLFGGMETRTLIYISG